jgi:sigma-B regulation protein RsbU (phosphoserine phosphatase)
MAHLGGFGAETAVTAEVVEPFTASNWQAPRRLRALLPRSFRTKFMLVVGFAVLFTLTVSVFIALWTIDRLARDASREVEQGLTNANQEYLRNYIETTALRTEAILDGVFSQVTALAGSMQTLLDHPETKAAIGRAVADDPYFGNQLDFDSAGDWAQNKPGAASVLSVWGYLLDADHRPKPEVAQTIADSSIFDLFSVSVMSTGASKLQVYYVGPKSSPILRTTPYSEQAQAFDKLYPGHDKANFWDFFFPGVIEGWQAWLKSPSSRPVASDITATEPYVDATTGNLISSFFHPLWTKDRTDVAGMVAADITLGQLADLVNSIKVANTGFGFLTMSNGNVLAVNATGEKALGLSIDKASGGQGVTGLNRNLAKSTQKAVASLDLPSDGATRIDRLVFKENGQDRPYIIALRRLSPINLWSADGKIKSESMTLGFAVPEDEVYVALRQAQSEIRSATERILRWETVSSVISLLLVLAIVFIVSRRITSGLIALATAARRMKNKDYATRVNISSGDEVGEVCVAFNSMADEIRNYTENLERLVAERTRELADATREITLLNEKLKGENLRLGAELDVARQVQLMVLPRKDELTGVPQLDISAHMNPADEVGGDYYDVLSADGQAKFGIGDVTGHGLESGVLMLMVQSIARGLYEAGEVDSKRFLEILNRAIFKNVARMKSSKHLTLAFVDYARNRITITGQHEELIVIRRDGHIERVDTIDLGFPVGLEDNIEPFLASRELFFEKGDVLILHTDGITEAANEENELFGIERLCDSALRHAAGAAQEIKEGILRDLMDFSGTRKFDDDITLLVVKHQ